MKTSAKLLLVLLLAGCAPDDSLWPAQLWREGEWDRIEDRELLGTFTMEGDTCYLRLKDGSVSHKQDFIRDKCYSALFEEFFMKTSGDYSGATSRSHGCGEALVRFGEGRSRSRQLIPTTNRARNQEEPKPVDFLIRPLPMTVSLQR